MKVLHYALALATGYGLIVLLQVLDKRWLQTPGVRLRSWNGATWGAAVFWLGELSLLGWFWVTRFRFDPWFRAARRARVASRWSLERAALALVAPPRGRWAGRYRRFLRGVLGVASAIAGFAIVAAAEQLVDTLVFRGVFDLPPFRR